MKQKKSKKMPSSKKSSLKPKKKYYGHALETPDGTIEGNIEEQAP